MTELEILTKAIEKAHKNGWMWHYKENNQFDLSCEWIANYQMVSKNGAYAMIYDHDFAKAFWGEEETPINWKSGKNKMWQIQLQKMVLMEEPIKYLERFLLKEESK